LNFCEYRIVSENALYHSTFFPTMISLTPRCRWKHEVWLHFFTKDAQNYPKTHSYEDNAKFHSSFWRQHYHNDKFNSALSPKCEVWLHFFTEEAQNHPKPHSYKDNTKWRQHDVLLANTGSDWEFLNPGKFEKDFWKCWLYCVLYLCISDWKMQKAVKKQTMKISCMYTFKVSPGM
jgi:hypothetical protein